MGRFSPQLGWKSYVIPTNGPIPTTGLNHTSFPQMDRFPQLGWKLYVIPINSYVDSRNDAMLRFWIANRNQRPMGHNAHLNVQLWRLYSAKIL